MQPEQPVRHHVVALTAVAVAVAAQVAEYWEVLNTALRAGIGRTVLDSLDCPDWLLQRVGLYRFMCYLLPSQEEMKAEAARQAAA